MKPEHTTTLAAAAERLTMTVEEAAEVLGISRNSAYEAVRRGEIPSLRLGRRILIPAEQLRRFLAGEQPVVSPGSAGPTPASGGNRWGAGR